MSDLRDLYQEMILDHGKNPRNFGELAGANRRAYGYNPLCGDRVKVFVRVDGDGRIHEVGFEGTGCAISTASASLMTSAVKGKTIEQARRIFDEFRELVTGDAEDDPDLEKLGKLAVFSGVSEFPSRVKCATLAWHTLQTALANIDETASTE